MISIVIPVKNRTDLFAITLRSILKQKDILYEIVVIDDNSKGTEIKDLAKEHNAIYIRNEYNMGAQESRNIGVRQSKYQFIAFLDSDDEWVSPDKLLRQYQVLSDNNNIAIVFTGLKYINNKGSEIIKREVNKHTFIYYDHFIKTVLKKDIIGTFSSVMIRKKDFIECGMCNTTLPARQDWDLWIRLSLRGDAYKITDCYTNYRMHANQISTNPKKKVDGYSQILINHNELYTQNNERIYYYIHLFKIVLVATLNKIDSKFYKKISDSNIYMTYSFILIATFIKLMLYLPFIGRFLKIKLLSTYLFRGIKTL